MHCAASMSSDPNASDWPHAWEQRQAVTVLPPFHEYVSVIINQLRHSSTSYDALKRSTSLPSSSYKSRPPSSSTHTVLTTVAYASYDSTNMNEPGTRDSTATALQPLQDVAPDAKPNTSHDGLTTTNDTTPELPQRDWRFWVVILSIAISQFLAAMELVRLFVLSFPPAHAHALGTELGSPRFRLHYPLSSKTCMASSSSG